MGYEVSDEAVYVALEAWYGVSPSTAGWSAHEAMRAAIEAYRSKSGSVDLWDEGYRAGLTSAQKLEADLAGKPPPMPMVPESEYTKAFARGVRIGREEAHAEMVTAEVGPSDYEVWRDALQLAVQYVGFGLGSMKSNAELIDCARWFKTNLMVQVIFEGEYLCPDCGTRAEPSYEPADGDRHAYEQGDDGCTHCDADALDLIHEVEPPLAPMTGCPECGWSEDGTHQPGCPELARRKES